MRKLEKIAVNICEAIKGLFIVKKICPLSDQVINSKKMKAYVRNEVKIQSTTTPESYRPTWQRKMNNGEIKNTFKNES